MLKLMYIHTKSYFKENISQKQKIANNEINSKRSQLGNAELSEYFSSHMTDMGFHA